MIQIIKKRYFIQLIRRLFLVMLIFALLLFFSVFAFLSVIELKLPNIEVLKDVHLKVPLRIFSRDGQLIEEFGEMRRIPIMLDQIPKTIIDATLATEDQRFYSHPGIDLLGLSRAAIVVFTTGKKLQGGSTITMQVARNFFLNSRKTYYRKIQEILLALEIDHELSKDKILELYFNKIFYGHRAYGIAAAAQVYFGKTLDQLNLPEIALLVGLPKAPSSLDPIRYPQIALDRRNHVLERMKELGYINQADYQSAIQFPITASYHEPIPSVKAPYVAEMAREEAIRLLGENFYDQGFDIVTTIDSHMQMMANESLDSGLLAYDKRHGYRGSIDHLNLDQPVDLTYMDSYLEKLATIPSMSGLRPSLVVRIQDTYISVLLKTGEIVTIPWKNMKWARAQIIRDGQEYLGSLPTKPEDVVAIGDIIYIQQNQDHEFYLSQMPEAEAALVALDPQNGAILALCGGFNFYRSNFNRAIQIQRQPGSSFKPFIYSAALDKGYTLATVINDAPVVLSDTGENMLWRPENDTQKFYGPTRLRVALRESRNLVSIRLLQLLGIPYVLDYVTRFGFSLDQMPSGLSLALGTALVNPLQMAGAYAVFANGGYKINPYLIARIQNNQGQTVYEAQPVLVPQGNSLDGANKVVSTPQPASTSIKPIQHVLLDENQSLHLNIGSEAPRVISAQNAYLMVSAMKDVLKYGTARGALPLLNREDLAGKTGTTNQKMDGWFCGFNPHLVAVTWIGFDQQHSLYEYAAKSALPIWVHFMKLALYKSPLVSMTEPDGIVSARINKKTGLLTEANDQDAMFELFMKPFVPRASMKKVDAVEDYQLNGTNGLY